MTEQNPQIEQTKVLNIQGLVKAENPSNSVTPMLKVDGSNLMSFLRKVQKQKVYVNISGEYYRVTLDIQLKDLVEYQLLEKLESPLCI